MLPASLQYRAFLSYAHADSAWGKRLHRSLERYSIGAHLVGRETRRGSVPKSLRPIFRDRENFSGGDLLTVATQEALDASGALIVLCSTVAATRPAVNEEVRLFRARHPERPVIPVIVEGAFPDNFPPSLRYRVLPDGSVTDHAVTILGPDLRESGDGWSLGLAKVVAGLIGMDADEIYRGAEREQRRRLRTWIAGLSGIIMLLLALTAWAEINRRDASFVASSFSALQLTQNDPLAGTAAMVDLYLDRPPWYWTTLPKPLRSSIITASEFLMRPYPNTEREMTFLSDGDKGGTILAVNEDGASLVLENKGNDLVAYTRGTRHTLSECRPANQRGGYLVGHFEGGIVFFSAAEGIFKWDISRCDIDKLLPGTFRHPSLGGGRKYSLAVSRDGRVVFDGGGIWTEGRIISCASDVLPSGSGGSGNGAVAISADGVTAAIATPTRLLVFDNDKGHCKLRISRTFQARQDIMFQATHVLADRVVAVSRQGDMLSCNIRGPSECLERRAFERNLQNPFFQYSGHSIAVMGSAAASALDTVVMVASVRGMEVHLWTGSGDFLAALQLPAVPDSFFVDDANKLFIFYQTGTVTSVSLDWHQALKDVCAFITAKVPHMNQQAELVRNCAKLLRPGRSQAPS